MPSMGLYLAWAAHCVRVVWAGSDLPAGAKKGSLKCWCCSVLSLVSPSLPLTCEIAVDSGCRGGTGYPPLFLSFLIHRDLSQGGKNKGKEMADSHFMLLTCLFTPCQR